MINDDNMKIIMVIVIMKWQCENEEMMYENQWKW